MDKKAQIAKNYAPLVRGGSKSKSDGASASRKPKQATAAKEKKIGKKVSQRFPQNKPQKIPGNVVHSSIWRWYDQWQVWQARVASTNKKTLFCGLCAFVSPGSKKMLKHFLAQHGQRKFYSCMVCDKPFCLRENAVDHMHDVHEYSKEPWRMEWGPRDQQTFMKQFDRDDGLFGRSPWDDDEDPEEEEEEVESDHEYREEYTGDGGDESDPDSEGAHDCDEDPVDEPDE